MVTSLIPRRQAIYGAINFKHIIISLTNYNTFSWKVHDFKTNKLLQVKIIPNG